MVQKCLSVNSMSITAKNSATTNNSNENFCLQVHAILKALPQNTQTEKRELDKETVKEQDDENVQKKLKDTTAKEQSNK